jgi:hypothetical protein
VTFRILFSLQIRTLDSNFEFEFNVSTSHLRLFCFFGRRCFLPSGGVVVPRCAQFEEPCWQITTSTTFGKVLPRGRLHFGVERWQNSGNRCSQRISHVLEVFSWEANSIGESFPQSFPCPGF